MKSQTVRSANGPAGILRFLECSSCSKPFYGKCNQELRSKNPYLLICGHSICESCHQSIGATDISCNTCQILSTSSDAQILTRNAYLVGRAFLANKEAIRESISYTLSQKPTRKMAKLSSSKKVLSLCYECSNHEATLNCQQCDCSFCDTCWTKVHSSGKSLMRHVPVNIKSVVVPKSTKYCLKHSTKEVDFFCVNCNLYICANCVIFDHKTVGHEAVLIKERNCNLLNAVVRLQDDVEENIAKMEETARHVKKLREATTVRDSPYRDLQRLVVQRFVHLHGVLQVAEETALQRLKDAENSGRVRLEEILNQLENQIRECKELVKRVADSRESDDLECSIALESLLEGMSSAAGLPSRLVKSAPEEPPKPLVTFDDTVVDALKNFCTLTIPDDEGYELRNGASPIQPKTDDDGKSRISDDQGEGSVSSYPLRPVISTLTPPPTMNPLPNIVEGQPYSVNVLYVKDPGEFYVIRSSMRRQQQRVDDLARKAALMCGTPTEVTKDEHYLVRYATDNKWYRGRVVAVTPPKDELSEPTVLINYFDYGNSESVPLNRLRKMPMQLMTDPPMALKCRLFECTPKTGEWCKASTKAMLEVLDNASLTMYVMKILPEALEVDLCCRSRDDQVDNELVSLRDTLIFLEYAKFVSGPVKTDRKPEACYLSQNLPKPGDSFRGVVSYVKSSSQFYVQKIGTDNQYLLQLMEKLNSTYGKSSQKFLIYNPAIDMPCAAFFPVDKRWYRGKIVDLPGNEMVTVLYVDFGNEETVSWKCVRKLRPEFLKLVPQAMRCSLSKLLDMSDLKWSERVVEHLEMCASEILRVDVASVTEKELKVVLYTSENVCLNAELIVASAGEEPLRTEEEESAPKSDEDEEPKPENSEREEDAEESANGYQMEMRVLRVTSPSDILLSVVCLEGKSEKLERELQQFYKKSKPEDGKWEEGSKCAVFSSSRNKWYRGCISQVLDDGKLRVEMKDIAETEDVPSSNVRKLALQFLSCPVSVVKCHLWGIFPPETEWPGLTCDFLISELEDQTSVYMTKAGDAIDGSVPVVLWVKKVTNTGALEPTVQELVSLNEMILQQGLAVPEKAKLIYHKWESRESSISEPIPAKSEESASSDVESITSYIYSDWLQPKAIEKRDFIGEATFVDSDGVIYIHDVEEDRPVLNMINESLLEHYRDSKPEMHDLCWSRNETCVVRYHLDKCWYRGRVLKVNDNLTYDVLFVDYGNVEVCQVSEMRRNIKFHEIPVLCRKFVLHGITPVSDDGRWPKDTVESLFSSVVERKCKIRVVRKSRDPSRPSSITLKVPEGDLDLAEVLVVAGLARCDDSQMEENGDVEDGSSESLVCVPQVYQKESAYFELELPPECKSFPIDVLTVRHSSLSAHILNDETTPPEVRKTIFDFVALTDDIQKYAESQPHLDQYVQGEPCVSLYSGNGKWYRAEVLYMDAEKDLVLVYYVDYGNREYLTKDRIRQCMPKWFTVPKMSLKCRLYNVRKCENVSRKQYLHALTECLSDYNLQATFVRKCGEYIEVEISKNNKLAYQTMINEGLMEFTEKM